MDQKKVRPNSSLIRFHQERCSPDLPINSIQVFHNLIEEVANLIKAIEAK